MAFFRGDFFSTTLNMMTSVSIIIPEGKANAEMNVLYLLHGLSDNCTCWTRLTSVERYANSYNVAVIIPEVQRSYYCDMKYGMKYFTYVSKELISFAHKTFNLPTSREKTFIAGLSMGGYGALKCALTFPEQYSACASFSSVCDIQNTINEAMPAANVGELSAILGVDLKVPQKDDLYYLATECAKSKVKPSFLATCGTEDMLYPQNIAFKNHMQALPMDYTFKEWQGDHTWEFWDKSLQKAMEFFFGEKTGSNKTPLSDGK